VSYALHGGGLLSSPLASSALMSYGAPAATSRSTRTRATPTWSSKGAASTRAPARRPARAGRTAAAAGAATLCATPRGI